MKESPIVQLVHEYEEEASQSTVTLLPSDEQEEEMSWFESETQIFCHDLVSVSCVSSFSEYLFKWCSAIVTLHHHRSKTDTSWEKYNSVATWLTQLIPTKSLHIPLHEHSPEKLDTLIAEPSENSVGDLNSILSGAVVNQTESTFELEPSHPQTVSQSILLNATTTPRSLSTAELSTESPKHKTLSETPEVSAQEEITTEEIVGSVTEKQSIPSIETELKETDVEERPLPEIIPKLTETVAQSECTIAIEGYEGEPKISSSETEKQVVSHLVESSSLEIKDDEQVVEETFLALPASGGLPRTATDFYAELQNSTDLGYANGNLVHGSNQKESVFMRLNNRIKALEVNMSLSSRYLEELSQRYDSGSPLFSVQIHLKNLLFLISEARLSNLFCWCKQSDSEVS